MGIDAFTVLAQVVNFLVLVLLLRKLLYRPILSAMREREAGIARQLSEANEDRQEAERDRAASLEERRELEARREGLLEEARREAAIHRRELEEQARLEVAEQRRRWHAAVEREKELLLGEIRERTEAETLTLTRRALAVLAGEDLEKKIVEKLLERIAALGDTAPRLSPGEPVTVRSGFPLPDPLRRRIEEALSASAAAPLSAEFQEDPDLLGGLEIRWRGHKLAWSLRGFLEGVEERLAEEEA